jgi:hypothetical protein
MPDLSFSSSMNPKAGFPFLSMKPHFCLPVVFHFFTYDTVYPCSIVASELVSDITVRIGTTKFYLHKVNDTLFSFI